MKLEDQVCCLELGRRMRELGVPQNSLWWWKRHDDGSVSGWFVKSGTMFPLSAGECSAFTAAELGEMLPRGYSSYWYPIQDGQAGTKWECEDDTGQPSFFTIAASEADARAKMLIYLIENGLIAADA